MEIERYAHKFTRKSGEQFFSNIHRTKMQVRMCDGRVPLPLYKIVLSEDADGRYWGWHDFKDDSYSMIWPSEAQLHICFPYGMKVAQEAGNGEPIRFSVASEVLVE